MQIKALRSLSFAKLSSSNSTSDVYWVTAISAGTPAGYCLSQMRSMVFPLWFTFPFVGTGRLILGSIEQCGSRWQAAAHYGRIVDYRGAPVWTAETDLGAGRGGGLLIRRLGLAGRAFGGRLGLCGSLGLCRLRDRLIS